MRRGETPRECCARLLTLVLQRDHPGATVERVDGRQGGEHRLDISRWTAQVASTHGFTAYCWDTMTECARNGITIVQWAHGMLEVSARESCCRVNRCPPHGHAEGCCSPSGGRGSRGPDSP